MILYFSSTGNCKYIAEQLAEKCDDKAVSILDTNNIQLGANEKLGFVFPTYFWRLPSIVDEYMKKLIIVSEDTDPYLYFIATYGSTCGQTGTYMKRHLASKGYNLSACFSIKTVDDWTVYFDVNDKIAINALLKEEAVQIEDIIPCINTKEKRNKMKGALPMIAVMGSNFFYNRARRTKHLNVNDACISCGLCQNQCPLNAIKITDGKPVWIKNKCTMCLHCLHYCPQFAIHYDNKTQNHGQYRHP